MLFNAAVKAAVVMAGTTEGFPPGHYELTKAPPLLLVHGTADELIPYRSAPLIYNQARGPKGLLTLVGGSHDAAGGQDPQSASTVIRTTTDFFEAYLTGNHEAGSRLATDGRSPTTKFVEDLTPGSRDSDCGPCGAGGSSACIGSTEPRSHQRRSGHRPMERLYRGQGHQYPRVLTRRHLVRKLGRLHVRQCRPVGSGSDGERDIHDAHHDGTDREWDLRLTHSCFIAVNNASSLTASNTKSLPISFAPAGG